MKSILARHISRQEGISSVEYAVILVLLVLAAAATVYWLADPTDPFNSLMPGTYNAVGNKVGQFGLVNGVGNQ